MGSVEGMADEIDPATLPPRDVYALLTSIVVPRPIAWVSTCSTDGVRNLAPHSYYNIISSEPPIVHFTSSGEKDTLRNARATGEFVVNVVSRPLLAQMNVTAADLPAGEDEFSWAELESTPSTAVAPPRVARAPAALECRLHSTLSIGNGTMVFGEVVRVHLADGVLRDGRADPVALAAVGRLALSGYSSTADPFFLDRATYAGLRTERGV